MGPSSPFLVALVHLHRLTLRRLLLSLPFCKLLFDIDSNHFISNLHYIGMILSPNLALNNTSLMHLVKLRKY